MKFYYYYNVRKWYLVIPLFLPIYIFPFSPFLLVYKWKKDNFLKVNIKYIPYVFFESIVEMPVFIGLVASSLSHKSKKTFIVLIVDVVNWFHEKLIERMFLGCPYKNKN